VLDTELHLPTSDEAALVVDLDLASLAAEWQVFVRNGERIRAEYSIYGDAEFDAGRRAVLEGFLARDRIYHTPWGARLEDRARRNLERALAGA